MTEPAVTVGKYGVIELQTTDTHGSYSHAVTALSSALDLHKDRFSDQLAENPEWAGRKIEGPNISNVFKRTFYQIAFKFQVTKRETSVGCALALPQPVWDSWQPFLGAPELHEQARRHLAAARRPARPGQVTGSMFSISTPSQARAGGPPRSASAW